MLNYQMVIAQNDLNVLRLAEHMCHQPLLCLRGTAASLARNSFVPNSPNTGPSFWSTKRRLVGGWANPSEKYEFVTWYDELPNWMEKKKCSKPPTSN